LEELLSVPNEDPFINILEHTTEIPVDRHGKQFGTISIKDVVHWHYSCKLGKWLYLHRNLVDRDKDGVETCMLCPSCFKKLCQDKKVPEFSLANINFGHLNCVRVMGKPKLQDLEQLTELERMIISPGRLFHTVLKLQENNGGMTTDRSRSALRGHFILFPHDSVNVSSKHLLSKKAWADNFSIELVCRKGKKDQLMASIFGTSIISGRAYAIMQYLRLFALLHQEPVSNDNTSLQSLQSDLDEFKKQLIDTAIINECSHMANVQDQMDADIAQVRTSSTARHRPQGSEKTESEHQQHHEAEPLTQTLYVSNGCVPNEKSEQVETRLLNSIIECISVLTEDVAVEELVPDGSQTCQQDSSEDRPQTRQPFSERETIPYNEFTEGSALLPKAFPDIFLCGQHHGKQSGALTILQESHILLQADSRAARCKIFQSFMDDQKRRHSNLQSVKGYFFADPISFGIMAKEFNSPSFEQQLTQIQSNPTGLAATEMFRCFAPVFRQISKKNNMKHNLVSFFYANAQRYGNPSTFMTCCPDDLSNTTAFRFALPQSSNAGFPSIANEEFGPAMENGTTMKTNNETKVPCDFFSMQRNISENPIASAKTYITMLEGLFSELLESVLNKKGSRSKKGHSVGALGTVLSAIVVNETTGKGTNHFHSLLYGGIPPWLISRVAHLDKELWGPLFEVLEGLFVTHLPSEAHVLALTETFIRESIPGGLAQIGYRRRSGIFPHAFVGDNPDKYNQQWLLPALYNQIHEHNFSCFKGKLGKSGCRMCYPRCLQRSSLIVELGEDKDNTGVPIALVSISPPTINESNCGLPLHCPDNRAMVMELKRPTLQSLPVVEGSKLSENLGINTEEQRENQVNFLLHAMGSNLPNGRTLAYIKDLPAQSLNALYKYVSKNLAGSNGNVVSFNRLITACMGCNTALYPLGNDTQSMSSVFYLGPYLGKGEPSMQQTLSIFFRLAQIIDTVPTVADDGETPIGKFRRTLGKTLNQSSKLEERSETKVAMNSLGTKDVLCTDSYKFFDAKHRPKFAKYVQQQKNLTNLLNIGDTSIDVTISDDNNTDDDDTSTGSTTTSASSESDDSIMSGSSTDEEREPIARLMTSLKKTEQQKAETVILPVKPKPNRRKETIIGMIRPYTIGQDKEEKRFVHDHLAYYLRGEAFRYVVPIEFSEITDITKRKNRQQENASGRSNSRYKLDPCHPLSGEYEIFLKSRTYTLQLVGTPPKWPSKPLPDEDGIRSRVKRTYQKKRDHFGSYYVALFGDYTKCYDKNHQDDCNEYNWDGFVKMVNKYYQDGTALSFGRLFHLSNIIFCMRLTKEIQTRISTYTARGRTMWTSEQKAMNATNQAQFRAWKKKFDDQNHELLKHQGVAEDPARKLLEFANLQVQLNQIMLPITLSISDKDIHQFSSSRIMKNPAKKREYRNHILVDSIRRPSSAIHSALIDFRLAQHGDNGSTAAGQRFLSSIHTLQKSHHYDSDYDSSVVEGHMHTHLSNFISMSEPQLTQEQKSIFLVLGTDLITRALYRLAHNGQPLYKDGSFYLIIGFPGVGKTTTLKKIGEFSVLIGAGNLVASAYTGVAACTISGVMFLSTFRINLRQPDSINMQDISDSKLISMKSEIDFANLGMLVIDEISQIPASWMRYLDRRLRQASSVPNIPFGGILVVFTGDFMQLPCTAGTPFPSSMMNYATQIKSQATRQPDAHTNLASNDYLFCAMFHQYAQCFIMNQVVRSANDPEYTKFITNMALGGSPKLDDILKFIQPLSPNDFRDDPDWMNATFLVNTNELRVRIIHTRTITYARCHNLPILRWPAILPEGMTVEDIGESYRNHPGLWQYFVPGIAGYLTYKINPALKLVNGTKVIYHSISFKTQSEADYVRLAMPVTKAGEFVTLSSPPESVNVLVTDENSKDLIRENIVLQDHHKERNQKDSSTVQIVIPIMTGLYDGKHFHIQDAHGRATTILAREPLGVRPAFCYTTDKAQSCTLPRTVVVFQQHDRRRTHSSVLVSLSRIQSQDRTRGAFPLRPDGTVDRRALEKISNLVPNKDVLAFLHGFGFGKPSTSFKTWNSDSAIAFQQAKGHDRHTNSRTAKSSPRKPKKYNPIKKRSQTKETSMKTDTIPAITSCSRNSYVNILHPSDNSTTAPHLCKEPLQRKSKTYHPMKTSQKPSKESNTIYCSLYALNTYGIHLAECQDAAHDVYHRYFASQQSTASAISIVDVRGDGHCGFYCLMLGLAHLNLFPLGITNVSAFRSNFVNQITEIPRDTLIQSLKPCFPSYGNETLNTEVQTATERIGAGSSWMDASIDLPLASLVFHVRIVLFDITMPQTLPGKFSYTYHEGSSAEVTSEIVQGLNLTESDISQILPTILIVRTPDHFMWITTARKTLNSRGQ
jgi:hypothetical protein